MYVERSWLESIRESLEEEYLSGKEPWEQSGFFGSYERWLRLRRSIAECVDGPGSFLDIGCANGFLLECIDGWCRERGIALELFGIDVLPSLIALAQERLAPLSAQLTV